MSNCNPDYNFWYVGARTQWNPVKDFALGVDVNYTKIETAFAGTANLASGIGASPTGSYSIKDQGASCAGAVGPWIAAGPCRRAARISAARHGR